MSSISKYFKGLFGGIGSLLTGMRVTLKELFTKKITQQYPENRDTLVISDRFKAVLVMPHDENNEHACTACGICQMNCPNGTIKVLSKTIETEEGKKKKILDAHIYDQGMCTFCNLCVLTCPQDAIIFSNEFENAIFTRSKLVMKLNHEGSKLREKKAAPKPMPKDLVENIESAEKAVKEVILDNEKPIAKKTVYEKPLEETVKEKAEPKSESNPAIDNKDEASASDAPLSETKE